MTTTFAPLLPLYVIIIAAALAAILSGFMIYNKSRGAWLRSLAFACLILAIANPILNDEDRQPVKDIVSVIVDKTQSQLLQDRQEQTDMAATALQEQLAKYKNFDVRLTEVENENRNNPSTNLFTALSESVSDVPADRVAGAIIISDGQIHDIPQDIENLESFGFDAPIHGLITGNENEFDLRVEVVQFPRFSIVGETQELSYIVHLDGNNDELQNVEFDVEVRLNGQFLSNERVIAGEEAIVFLEVPRRGENLIELSVQPFDEEVSQTNNITIAKIEGIRQNLRVLLVSGAPHSGERAWRNLLKSDTSIDLVHFTILRPPNRNDGTPINELSLIAFPTRELFLEKIDEFDLIIFDRYQRLGVLSILYYDNIARYVEDGGALLIAAGPEMAGIQSIASTPLSPVIPATPTGEVSQIGFYPRISDVGEKHPVSRGLPGGEIEPPQWGRWFRSIGVQDTQGHAVLSGPDDQPLLLLNRVNEGRVAMLLSDHGWLWSRGFEGGGPHVSLYRRIAHWLMKEPVLEEEALFADASGDEISILRQSMADNVPQTTIISPSGNEQSIEMVEESPGQFRQKFAANENGLYQIKNGEFNTLAHVGDFDAAEFKQSVSTLTALDPMSQATGGITTHVIKGDQLSLPQIVPVRQVSTRPGQRMQLRTSNQSILLGINQIPLIGGFLGLAILLFALSTMWYREGR